MPHHYPNLTAWFLADSQADPDTLFFGALLVGGLLADINAYQAELQGIHDLLVAIEFFCNQYGIAKGGIMVGCDNQGALTQSQWFTNHVPCANVHADLICTITTL